MEMEQLRKELECGVMQTVYLLYGEEVYLRRQYEERIRKTCVTDEDTINYQVYDGKDISVENLIESADTMPFFADKRLLVLKNTEFFVNGNDKIAEYVEKIPETTCIVFVEEKVDKRTKIYKAVNKAGGCVEFRRQKTEVLEKWILSMLKKENKKITGGDLELFLQKTGDDMNNIYQELEKLICYVGNRDAIMGTDIEQICTSQITNQIFEMLDAMTDKNIHRALELYYDLLSLKEAPLKILALINRQFNILLQVKDLSRQGKDKKEIASLAGVHPYYVGRNIRQAGGFTMEQLRQALEDSVQTEEDVKMGRITDRLGVELLIVKYSYGK